MTDTQGMDWTVIDTALAGTGLFCRGGFTVDPGEDLPRLGDGGKPHSVVLIGNAGSAIWAPFCAAPEARDGAPNPMNRWTRRVVDKLGQTFGAVVLYPFEGPPYYPFQQWALRAGGVHVSPLGILIHAEYGLWHAYRAALLLAQPVEPLAPDAAPSPSSSPSSSPCESCAEKPCLTACPVGAFQPQGYDVDSCRGHVRSADGAACLKDGCLARRACPVGVDLGYSPGHAEFHMMAFAFPEKTG